MPGSPCTNLATYVNGKLVPKDANDVGTTYKANVTWKIDPDHLVYGTVSRGFRPGGINRRAGLEPYASDFLQNYEIGFKTSWFDRALKINGAFFWQEWEKFQFAFLGANSFTEIHNGPNARIRGIEADVNWTVAPGFTFTGAGHLHRRQDAAEPVRLRRRQPQLYRPRTAGTDQLHPGAGGHAAAGDAAVQDQRHRPLRGAARHVAQGPCPGHVVHASSASSDIRTLAFAPGTGDPYNPAAGLGRLAAYTTFDFAAGLNWPFLSAEIVIENAFDKRAQLSRYQECGSCFQRPYVVANVPRTIGLRLGHSF